MGVFNFCKFRYSPASTSGECFGETLYEAVGRVEGWLIDRTRWLDNAFDTLDTQSARKMIKNVKHKDETTVTIAVASKNLATMITLLALLIVVIVIAGFVTKWAMATKKNKQQNPYTLLHNK